MASIAILLCTHNGEAFLAQQLLSLAAQTLRPIALFVHDWNSRDSTCALVEKFAAEQSGAMHVELHRHTDAPGAHRSFVAGLRACLQSDVKFDYLSLCDQDDVWAPDKLVRYAQAIDASAPPSALLYGDVLLIDAAGREIAPSFFGPRAVFRPPHDLRDPGLLLANPVIGMTVCVSRPCLADCAAALDGPWLMHDWALALLAVSRGHRTTYVPQPLVSYRQHDANVLGAAQGLRLRQRICKASGHFALVRRQAEWLGATAAWSFGAAAAGVARPGPAQRFRAARAAVTSTLLGRRSRFLLACAVLLFW